MASGSDSGEKVRTTANVMSATRVNFMTYIQSHERFIKLVRPDLNTQGLFLKKEFVTLAAVFTRL